MRDAGEGAGPRFAERGAGVEVMHADAEGFAAADVIEEVVACLRGFCGVRLREVDEVACVREDLLFWVVPVLLAGGGEGGDVSGWDRGGGPFALGFEEEGEGICAD